MAIITVETMPGKTFTTRIDGATRSSLADEPVADGGADDGYSPYELLLASLGSCTAMTLQLYARRKQWPLERVKVRLEFDRVHEKDSEDCEAPTSRIDRIQRDFWLEGPLTSEQRARLLEIAGRCPVHRTITGNPRILDRLVEAQEV
ncbi:MAG: OsmC family protein [Thermomicrobiales bacterium]